MKKKIINFIFFCNYLQMTKQHFFMCWDTLLINLLQEWDHSTTECWLASYQTMLIILQYLALMSEHDCAFFVVKNAWGIMCSFMMEMHQFPLAYFIPGSNFIIGGPLFAIRKAIISLKLLWVHYTCYNERLVKLMMSFDAYNQRKNRVN